MYLKKLKPDINLKIWLSGYDKEGTWKRELCTEYSNHLNDNKITNTTNKNKSKKINAKARNKNINTKNKNDQIVLPISSNLQSHNELQGASSDILLGNIMLPNTAINASNNSDIIDLRDSPDVQHIPAEFFNSQWRHIYNEYMRNNDNIQLYENNTKIWQLNENEMQIIEMYYLQAENMHQNNVTNVHMPNYLLKYCHEPQDVLSLKRNNWLTGTIIDVFLLSINVHINTGQDNNDINILPTTFYASLSNTLDDNLLRPRHNTYNFSAIRTYVDHYTREDFLKSTIIPVHIRDHWLLCIIDPPQKTIYFIDSLRKTNTVVMNYILQWYQTELIEHGYDLLEYNTISWTIINSLNVPLYVPRQRDGSSCGIFVCMTAFYWYKYKRLPHKNNDWNESNINSLRPNLRHFILHHIFHTVYLENRRLLETEL